MQYRAFGNTGFEVSLLGMGCMRLPFLDEHDKFKGVDREKAYELIRYAVDNGINYFDTAYGYHGTDSEAVLGEALEENGRRQKVKIVTKQPFGVMTTQADIRRNLEHTLKKLRTDYVDVYLVHCIVEATWGDIQKREIFAEFEKFKSEGLIKHIGFSYHGLYPTFEDVVKRYPWEMCLIQQNLIDVDKIVTEKAIYLSHKHNLAIAIMEPLRGGGLCYAPKSVAELYDNFPIKRSPTEWAFRHLTDYPEIATMVSGMTTMEQLKENLAIFAQPDMKPNCLTPEEKSLIVSARKAYDAVISIPCTECGYCMPCPFNVNIPQAFALYNDGHRFGHFDQPRRSYMFVRRGKKGANLCTSCDVCVPKCPQEIDIPKELKVAHAALDGWDE
ncbi:MAG: aldo/keto reductase [Defluviitaleaceae bacterium]|nr:aldo/keto reductase [Defluviitaleaceae bacterium]